MIAVIVLAVVAAVGWAAAAALWLKRITPVEAVQTVVVGGPTHEDADGEDAALLDFLHNVTLGDFHAANAVVQQVRGQTTRAALGVLSVLMQEWRAYVPALAYDDDDDDDGGAECAAAETMTPVEQKLVLTSAMGVETGSLVSGPRAETTGSLSATTKGGRQNLLSPHMPKGSNRDMTRSPGGGRITTASSPMGMQLGSVPSLSLPPSPAPSGSAASANGCSEKGFVVPGTVRVTSEPSQPASPFGVHRKMSTPTGFNSGLVSFKGSAVGLRNRAYPGQGNLRQKMSTVVHVTRKKFVTAESHGSFASLKEAGHASDGSVAIFVKEVLDCFDHYDAKALHIGAEEISGSWNAAATCPVHAQRGAQCALTIARSLNVSTIGRKDQAGVGVSTGLVMVGVAGNSRHLAGVAIGEPLQRAGLLAGLCSVIGARALADESAHAGSSSVVCSRVVDTVDFGVTSSGLRSQPTLVYELSAERRPDGGYITGFGALLSRQLEDAVRYFTKHLREHPSDGQCQRLLRLALLLRQTEVSDRHDYARAWVGWERWDAHAMELPVPSELADVLDAGGVQVPSPCHRRPRASLMQPEGDLLRQKIEAQREARFRAVADDTGIPLSFQDQRCRRWYRSGQLLGKGGFGEVWLGMSSEGSMIAIKSLKLPENLPPLASPKTPIPATIEEQRRRRSRRKGTMDASQAAQLIEELLREVVLMTQLRHHNIVSFLGSAVEGDFVLVVMEYCSGGSVQGVLQRFGHLPPPTVVRYTKDMLKGLDFLHGKDIVHRDLKPHNVLCTIDGVAKLADFGASAELRDQCTQEDVKGTPLYMAPEAARGHACKGSDIWGLGVVVCELATSVLPWPCALESDFHKHQFLYRLAKDEDFRPELPDDIPDGAAAFVQRCLQADADARPSASELQNDVYLLQ